MVNENGNYENELITIEIAKKLASDGRYNDAYSLLRPLVRSPYSVEASIIIAKIYAQNRDFESAEKYFLYVLQIDGHNLEALEGLKKCRELKDSPFRTFLSFNKLKLVALLINLIILICLITLFFLVR